ncbi:MAG: DUF2281 domain-containing protein [Patescibacteria group bacterium]
MNYSTLKTNNYINLDDKPMVLLPLYIYEKITKMLSKINSKNLLLDIEKTKVVKKINFSTLSSESSLSKDWLRPEEEKTWQNL